MFCMCAGLYIRLLCGGVPQNGNCVPSNFCSHVMSPNWAMILGANPLNMVEGTYGHTNSPAHVMHILQVEHCLCVQ